MGLFELVVPRVVFMTEYVSGVGMVIRVWVPGTVVESVGGIVVLDCGDGIGRAFVA